MLDSLLMAIVLAALIVASYVDLKYREVPDWISYGLIFVGIGLRLIDSIVSWNYHPILYGLIGLGATFVVALLMFYAGVWGGGDSKILMGLGAVIGFDRISSLPFLTIFILAAFFISGMWGTAYAFYLASRRWKQFKKEFREIRSGKIVGILRLMTTAFLLIAILLFLFFTSYPSLTVLSIAIVAFLIVQAFIFMKAVEISCLISEKPVSDLVEGDWIVKDVVVKRRRICGPKDLGLTKHQIGLLKTYKIKKVLVKDGIPFVPSFLLAYSAAILLTHLKVF